MNKVIFYIFIIVFFVKTGNVFSSNNIFDVDNIVVKNIANQNKEELLNKAFKEGFKKLTKKILINKDLLSVEKTSLREIKKLVSTYQIIENEEVYEEEEIKVNLSFDREKINRFFYVKGISYADITETDVVIFPVLIKKNDFFLYSENYFYNNWPKQHFDEENEFIKYVLPVENLEDLQLINSNKDDLESLPIAQILSNYDLKDYIFLVLTVKNNKIDVFLKGSISGNKVIKNFKVSSEDNSEEIRYNNAIKEVKKEIDEIWKLQNQIDIRTPSFLNTVLEIKKDNDLLNLRKALNKIDLIESYSVIELSTNYAKIKIKYLGKINKIKSKLDNQGIKVIISNNEWKLKLI